MMHVYPILCLMIDMMHSNMGIMKALLVLGAIIRVRKQSTGVAYSSACVQYSNYLATKDLCVLA